MNSRVVLRPPFGLALAVAMWLVCLVCEVALLTSYGVGRAAQWTAPIALVAYGCWLLFWRPAVIVEPFGVGLRNVLRTHQVSWPAIQRIDTKYALTLHTTAGRYVAWAAPAPSRFSMINARRQDIGRLPETTYGPSRSIGPGDLPRSDSGVAAYHVRHEWEALRDAGHLDSGIVEGTGVVTTWHLRSAAVLGALVALTLVSGFAR